MSFELILCLLTLLSGLTWGFIKGVKFLKGKYKYLQLNNWHKIIREPIDFMASLFPIFLIVFIFRSFMFEPFVIPSGSLEPTLEIGDFILVNKFDYGIRWPLSHQEIISTHAPKRGDIMVFLYPEDRKMYFIKRVVGVPGDIISYIDKTLYINGKAMPQKVVGPAYEYDEHGNIWPVEQREENLDGVRHSIFVRPDIYDQNLYQIKVPPKSYFVLGDNRDDSRDSRYWGFVSNDDVVGKAAYIWFSWNSQTSEWADKIRFQRMFTRIK